MLIIRNIAKWSEKQIPEKDCQYICIVILLQFALNDLRQISCVQFFHVPLGRNIGVHSLTVVPMILQSAGIGEYSIYEFSSKSNRIIYLNYHITALSLQEVV